MQKLPLHIKDFEIIRQSDLCYIDKTESIYKLVSQTQGRFILETPSYYGKTLFLSTLVNLFEGKKNLFEGLYINEKTDWSWDSFPIIEIDFNLTDYSTPELFEETLRELLVISGKEHGVTITATHIPGCLKELVTAIASKENKPVVILIDDYDKSLKPYLDNHKEFQGYASSIFRTITKLTHALGSREITRNTRFSLITGTGSFTDKTGIPAFPGMTRITYHNDHASLIGFTREELQKACPTHIKNMADSMNVSSDKCLDMLEQWYGIKSPEGFQTKLDPYSTISSLANNAIKHYRYVDSPMNLQTALMIKERYPVPALSGLCTPLTSFYPVNVTNPSVESLLYIKGLLAITAADNTTVTLSPPNDDARHTLYQQLYTAFFPAHTSNVDEVRNSIQQMIREHKAGAFIAAANKALSSIKKESVSHEDTVYNAFYLILTQGISDGDIKVLHYANRLDLVLTIDNSAIIISCKCNTPAGSSLLQAKSERYLAQIDAIKENVAVFGINFDTTEHKIVEWKHEKITG